jgi:hypothetical protein
MSAKPFLVWVLGFGCCWKCRSRISCCSFVRRGLTSAQTWRMGCGCGGGGGGGGGGWPAAAALGAEPARLPEGWSSGLDGFTAGPNCGSEGGNRSMAKTPEMLRHFRKADDTTRLSTACGWRAGLRSRAGRQVERRTDWSSIRMKSERQERSI